MTNNSVKMTVLSGGNVGIGTTNPSTPLHVSGGVGMTGGWGRSALLSHNFPVLVFESQYSSSAYAGIGYDNTTGLKFFVNASAVDVTGSSAAALAMTILDNHNVGIGTASPNTLLHLSTTGGTQLRLTADDQNYAYIEFGDTADEDIGTILYSNIDDSMRFITNAGERMRINNSGLVTMHAAGVVARDTNLGGAVFTVQSNNGQGLAIGYGTGTNEYRRLYQHTTGLYFQSSTNQAYLNASGAWVDASDITLKKDIQDIDYGIETVKKLKPRKYKMKSDDTEQIGFIAQEIIEQVPEIVDGKDGVLGVAYGHITSVLTKAIQEQQVIIDDLKARMAALEG